MFGRTECGSSRSGTGVMATVTEVFKLLKELTEEVRFLGMSMSAEQGSCLWECLGGICNGSVSLGMLSSPATIHSLTPQYPVLSIKKIMSSSMRALDAQTAQRGLHLEIEFCNI